MRINCGKVCNQYKTEVQEILEGIDKILEEGHCDFEGKEIYEACRGMGITDYEMPEK